MTVLISIYMIGQILLFGTDTDGLIPIISNVKTQKLAAIIVSMYTVYPISQSSGSIFCVTIVQESTY